MKTVLTLLAAAFIFSSAPRPEPKLFTVQNEQTKAKYQEAIMTSYPKGFVKSFEIVKINKNITSLLELPGVTQSLTLNFERSLSMPVDDKVGGGTAYFWRGTISNEKDGSGFQLLKLTNYPNVLSGLFSIDGRTFQLNPVDENYASLIEIDQTPPYSCGTKNSSKEANNKSSSDCTPTCSGTAERVRFVIDSELRAMMNQSLTYRFAVIMEEAWLRGTITNSLNNPILQTAYTDLDFTNTSFYPDDLNTFNSWVNANLPNVNKAVLLTTHDYADIYAAAKSIPGDVALVEVFVGTPGWLSAHEVGHLYGGNHDNVTPEPPSPFCARAFKDGVVNGSTATPIVSGMNPYLRQTFYSHPGTYGSTTRWNAGVIQNNWCN